MFIWPYFYLALPSIASSPRADCFEAFNTISAGPGVFHSHLSLVGGPQQTPVGACSLFSKDLQPQPKTCYSLRVDAVTPPAPFTPFPPSVGGNERNGYIRAAAGALSLRARRPHRKPKPHGQRFSSDRSYRGGFGQRGQEHLGTRDGTEMKHAKEKEALLGSYLPGLPDHRVFACAVAHRVTFIKISNNKFCHSLLGFLFLPWDRVTSFASTSPTVSSSSLRAALKMQSGTARKCRVLPQQQPRRGTEEWQSSF